MRRGLPRASGGEVMWNETSQSRLEGVDPRLVAILAEAQRRTGIPFQVSEGLRARARQQEMVNQGKSQTMNSRHLTGNATDIHILNPDGSVNWDFEAYRPIADAAKQIAAEMGYGDFVWGGDWKTLKDGVHFQLGGGGHSHGAQPSGGNALAAAPGQPQGNALTAFLPQEQPQQNALAVFQPVRTQLDPRAFMTASTNYTALPIA